MKVHSPSYKEREYLSLRILIAIGKNFLAEKNPLTFKGIAKQLNLPLHLTKELISSLLDSNLLIELDGYEQEAYIPARSLNAIRMSDVICTVKGNQRLSTESGEDKIILELLTSGDKKLEEFSGNKNLREILDDLERLKKQKTD